MLKKADINYRDNDNDVPNYRRFKIIILQKDNEVFEVSSDIIDRNFESRKVFDILRNALPSNIQIESELYN